jgi:integral membrane protein
MFNFSKTPIGTLRLTGISEGFSFLILLFIAMPLKYFAGMPLAVKYAGWIHGILFILYVLALIRVKALHKWSVKKTFVGFIAALLPFGTFVFDTTLRKEEKALQ